MDAPKPAFFQGFWWWWVAATPLVALFCLADLASFLAARSWAVTTGVVLEEEYVSRAGKGDYYRLTYRFEAGGQEYTGVFKDRIDDSLGPARLDGDRVAVYYDPRDPRRSTLDRRLSLRNIRYVPWWAAIGLWLYWSERRPLRKKAERP
jgi:hypothetical protein